MNIRKTLVAALLAVSALLLRGCTSHVTNKQHYSNLLADYSQLKPSDSASDAGTSKPSIRVVRKAFAKTVINSVSRITFDDLKPGIDMLVRDTLSFNTP
ncbi:hypothetical protein [Pantoea sp. Lij88]|uniref:hypothetical protein n=1 Tax=Pantoea sp. Lij88 TaxID=3028622 RepID=UPI0024BA2129|nr:hypothetical protein [Pantoea sp. Lij88]WHQ74406.1 hypothetical protein PU624_16515 [Pantoea sp. Lij88]